MTDHAAMARRYWARWLPHRYAQIPDPERFFVDLGREVSREIEALTLELEGPDPAGETYRDRLGRMSAARTRAVELVLAERVLPAPEPGTDPDEEPYRPDDPLVPTNRAGELPLVVVPGDPLWEEILEEERRAAATLRRGRFVR